MILNNIKITFLGNNCVLRTLVKKISITIIAKLGNPNLFVLKTNKQYSKMTITASEMRTDIVLLISKTNHF